MMRRLLEIDRPASGEVAVYGPLEIDEPIPGES